MQNYYNLVYREEEREMMPLCAHEGIAVIPWSPMARGYLAGSGIGDHGMTAMPSCAQNGIISRSSSR